MLRFWSCLVLDVAPVIVVGAAIQGCSDSTPGTSSDASGTSADVTTDAGGGANTDAGDDGCVSLRCDASPTDPTPGRDGATPTACVQCIHSKCGSELAACAVDCACGPANACLLNNKLNYSICMDGITVISSGNCALKDLAGCIATACVPECQPDGG